MRWLRASAAGCSAEESLGHGNCLTNALFAAVPASEASPVGTLHIPASSIVARCRAGPAQAALDDTNAH
ncbi:hypothetical protein GN244_ATG06130 [Phytophthora infestans]|uniref:Uncharacterized protein n=1 Tax=Phytophthora infestans TaxID=4787 RepID=A0A833WHB3_PHYIN|nr:hypothetical protein GN244_ATG06130 [Phytophthora infestans]KAF4146761.1 hypothetical protein GN958_ATG04015 [Phytophthora infestans]